MIELGFNYSNNEKSINVSTIELELSTFELKMKITKIPIGIESITKLVGQTSVGTLFKPNKRLIKNMLSNYKNEGSPFSNDGWMILSENDDIIKSKKLNDVFDYHINQNKVISRFIKIKKIKEKNNK